MNNSGSALSRGDILRSDALRTLGEYAQQQQAFAESETQPNEETVGRLSGSREYGRRRNAAQVVSGQPQRQMARGVQRRDAIQSGVTAARRAPIEAALRAALDARQAAGLPGSVQEVEALNQQDRERIAAENGAFVRGGQTELLNYLNAAKTYNNRLTRDDPGTYFAAGNPVDTPEEQAQRSRYRPGAMNEEMGRYQNRVLMALNDGAISREQAGQMLGDASAQWFRMLSDREQSPFGDRNSQTAAYRPAINHYEGIYNTTLGQTTGNRQAYLDWVSNSAPGERTAENVPIANPYSQTFSNRPATYYSQQNGRHEIAVYPRTGDNASEDEFSRWQGVQGGYFGTSTPTHGEPSFNFDGRLRPENPNYTPALAAEVASDNARFASPGSYAEELAVARMNAAAARAQQNYSTRLLQPMPQTIYG